ncbi:MAG: carboxypeptidase-like regulatory domain-containing protein [Isosphaeraceae bacterium]
MRQSMALLVAASSLALGMTVGCGGGKPGLVPVSGTVTLEGQPVSRAHIAFEPRAENAATTPGGDITGASGYYKAMHEGRSGLSPGKYVVRVSINGPESANSASGGGDEYMRSLAERSRTADDPNTMRHRIEEKFDREIPSGGGTFDFDLKKPPPPEPVEPPTKPGTKKKAAPGKKGQPPGSPLDKMYRNG